MGRRIANELEQTDRPFVIADTNQDKLDHFLQDFPDAMAEVPFDF